MIFQFEDFNSFIRQFSRLVYPWLLLCVYNLLIIKNTNDPKKISEILKFTSISIYFILIPDFLSLIYTAITNTNNLIILKLASITYRETNTTAFLLFYTIIFRIENKLANRKEILFAFLALTLTFSRSSIFLFFVYVIYKLINDLFEKFDSNNFKLIFSRLFPFLILGAMYSIYLFLKIDSSTMQTYALSIYDKSFGTRILIFDFINYYFSTIDFSEILNFLIGYGWVKYQNLLAELPFIYEGTVGHTFIGILPEYGFIYTSFLFLFFYIRAFRGFIADCFLVGLSILAFFPFPYASPILCLIQVHRRLNFLNNRKISISV
ncbi:hypothetical protein HA142_07185 [Prochlorococcus marinus str. XMU1401]|uniref:Wzy n=2 Tax=Prochlorococcus marinus TaxID=1219 RepID=A0A8I2BKQ0_PROMR|nr:hypothetical protein [Prochlorococcus marinus]MBO8223295.1 hypothetical protein [Prochlorococcus marinus str. XMU1401]MCQ9198947.1 hypothetical protein [Prochlorococcus marinus XMU1429]